jgi:hypothetical protein
MVLARKFLNRVRMFDSCRGHVSKPFLAHRRFAFVFSTANADVNELYGALRCSRSPTLASVVGVLAGAAIGASFFLYALATDLGNCAS